MVETCHPPFLDKHDPLETNMSRGPPCDPFTFHNGRFWLLLPGIKCSCALWELVLVLPAGWVQSFPEHLTPVTVVCQSRREMGQWVTPFTGYFQSIKLILGSFGSRDHNADGFLLHWYRVSDDLCQMEITCRGSRARGGTVGKLPSTCLRAQV